MTNAETKSGSLNPLLDLTVRIVLCITTLVNAFQWDAITELKNEVDLLKAKLEVEATPLSQIMDDEIKTKIQEAYAESASEIMDDLPGKKVETHDVLIDRAQEIVAPFFKERGVTIRCWNCGSIAANPIPFPHKIIKIPKE